MAAEPRSFWTPEYGLIALSFVPLLVKAVDYLSLGSIVPMAVFVGFAVAVGLAIRVGGRAERRVLRVWGFALVLWGLARFVVLGTFVLTPVSEAHVESQLTLWFVLVSLVHIGLGGYIVTRARSTG